MAKTASCRNYLLTTADGDGDGDQPNNLLSLTECL